MWNLVVVQSFFNRSDNKSTLKDILIPFYKFQIDFHLRFPVNSHL